MLRVIQPGAERPPAPDERTAREVRMVEGFYELERDDTRPFRWMGPEARLAFDGEEGTRFLELPVFTEFLDLSQRLALEVEGRAAAHELLTGWNLLSHEIPAGAAEATLVASKLLPRSHHPGDGRALAFRVGIPRVHADAERHRGIAAIQDNRILNRREMEAGRTVLESTPPHLGVDLHGACNVKPPCVYCDWDGVKEEEGDLVDAPFTRETLEAWGPFFDNAESLINCGIGEPFMMKNLDELLDVFARRGKVLEMATNGQILPDRIIEKLVGRDVRLTVSLDAATPETYARLRNDALPKILDNLRRLIAAKGGKGRNPKVWLNFMPMKANAHELEAFVELCADLDVDLMILRPLNFAEDKGLEWERAGYRFVYEEELLPFAELVRISGRAAELCRRHGVALGDFLDFGDAGLEESFAEDFAGGRREVAAAAAAEAPARREPAAGRKAALASPAASGEPAMEPEPAAAETAAEPAVDEDGGSLGEARLPICREPWEHFYILRRGILPCCYGQGRLGPMDRWESVWNSTLLQEIRGDLAAGRLHEYCLESPACPIVRKRLHGGRIPLDRVLVGKLRRLYQRIDRLGFGAPGKVYRGLRRVVSRSARGAAAPGA